MSQLYVQWNALQSKASEIKGISTKLNSIRGKLESVKSNLSGMSGFGSVTSTINSIMLEIERQSKSAKDMGEKLNTITTFYKLTEQKISGVTNSSDKVMDPDKLKDLLNLPDISPEDLLKLLALLNSAGSPDSESSDESIISSSDIWDLLSSAGVAGQGLAGLGALFNGSMGEWTDLPISASKLLSSFGDLAKNAYATGDDLIDPIKLLFGTNLDDNIKNAVTVGDAVSNYGKGFIDDLVFSSAKNVGQNIKVATTWGGHILTGVTNIVDNYEEFGGNMNGRFWGETAIETAADIGVGIGAGAVATAAVAALGFSAPAIAVGALAVGIAWGANALVGCISKAKTGEKKDIGEVLSDLVFD